MIALSPAVDRNYSLQKLIPGGFHRCPDPVINAGGKGINVARVLSLLGARVTLTGFFAGDPGRFILEDLKSHGIFTEPLFLQGETRSTINILEREDMRETEILEPGPRACAEDLSNILKLIEGFLNANDEGACIVFSGGIPAGLGSDTYAVLIDKTRSLGARCFLDTSAEALMYGINAEPFFIKPNIREFASVTGWSASLQTEISARDVAGIASAARTIGVPVVAVTLSGKGAVLCTEDRAFYAHPLPVVPVNTIGSGDSFTAGFAYSTASGEDIRSALSTAVACAASNAVFEKVGYIDPGSVRELRQQVTIEEF